MYVCLSVLAFVGRWARCVWGRCLSKLNLLRKGQLLVKLGPYHAEPHEAEATPKADNVRTETPYPYLPPKVELVIFPANGGVGGPSF